MDNDVKSQQETLEQLSEILLVLDKEKKGFKR